MSMCGWGGGVCERSAERACEVGEGECVRGVHSDHVWLGRGSV